MAGIAAVAIPAYQAAATVGEVVTRARSHLADVLVVDDGSTDTTFDVAREAGARCIRLPRNRGKGRALRSAFRDLFGCGFDLVVTLDADGQHRPEEIPSLLEAAWKGADMVVGSRAAQFGTMGRVRRTSNRISSWLISRVVGGQLPDIQSGFRLYRRGLIEAVGFHGNRFEAESAVVVRAIRQGFRVATVPIRVERADGRSTSHYRPLRDSLRIAGAVVQARFRQGRAGE